jgi:hypothetical protein
MRGSKCSERASARVLALAGLMLAASTAPRDAFAQSCCAGTAAVTPGRLALHEDALVGVQLRAAALLGSWAADGRYVGNPSGTSEQDFEQDLVATLRVLQRGQVTVFAPFVETRRTGATSRGPITDAGGGLGDVNLAARWDFTLAGESDAWPGVALLAGVTLPTGRAPDASTHVLAADATGIGAFQGNLGLALEQTFGSWLVDVTALVAQRTPRTANGVRTTLGTQLTFLGAVGYTFESESAVAFVASYTREADATIKGDEADGTGNAFTQLALTGMVPLDDRWRVQGSLYLQPPLAHFGRNHLTTTGMTLFFARAWS